MAEIINVKGHNIKTFNSKLASYRRAQIIQNDIVTLLAKIGAQPDDVEIPLQKLVIRTYPAEVECFLEGHRLFYKYSAAGSFISNLHTIFEVLKAEILMIENGEKRFDQFLQEFSEDDDIDEQRKQARELLGIEHDCMDLEKINKAYKKLAMVHHPDRPDGDHEMFKKINHAHKILKRELR